MAKVMAISIVALLSLLIAPLCLGADPFFADWMGNLSPMIGQLTLLDICLPGTHDTMTYDLSTTVSDGGLDNDSVVVWILQTFSSVLPEGWIRQQSQTQGLDITTQLNNGMRYIDFRLMYTESDWYCLHCMRTNQKSMVYLTAIRDWLLQHPHEIVTLTLSKHGGVCDKGEDQYPKVSVATKQAMWAQIETVFGGLLFDSSKSKLNTTTISTLVATNQRVVVFASDYVEFTNSSKFALDACAVVNNTLDASITSPQDGFNSLVNFYSTAQTTTMPASKSTSSFLLLSMACSSPESQLRYAFEVEYIPVEKDYHTKLCCQTFTIPNVTEWCPAHLLDMSQTLNFYNQIVFDLAFNNSWWFPNAIYLDAIDDDGTIRTGTDPINLTPNKRFATLEAQSTLPIAEDEVDVEEGGNAQAWLLRNGTVVRFTTNTTTPSVRTKPPAPRVRARANALGATDAAHATTKFAYVATVLYYNLRKGCGGSDESKWSTTCTSVAATIRALREKYPLDLWTDTTTGRDGDWLK